MCFEISLFFFLDRFGRVRIYLFFVFIGFERLFFGWERKIGFGFGIINVIKEVWFKVGFEV